MQIIGVKDISIQLNNISIEDNFLSHIFFVGDKFMISKFVSRFVENLKIGDFDYGKFANCQINFLNNLGFWMSENIVLDLSDCDKETFLAIVNFWQVIRNYTNLIGENFLENKVLQINIESNSNLKQIYEDSINFLDNEVKSISFLPLELLRHIKDDIAWTNQKGTKIDQILQTKQNISISNIQAYRPTRANVRFFLYHFFGFSLFSEERQSTVNFGTITEPEKHITQKLGIETFEGGQFDIIKNILANQNTLGILSTGSGKSITFLLSGMIKKGVTFIISPLKSLIDDQYSNLEDKFFLNGITGKVHSGLDSDDKKENESFLGLGKYKFFYCAPERLMILNFIKNVCEKGIGEDGFSISQIVIDEAHCLSERGHDFRFAYLNIKLFVKYLQNKNIKTVPILALTATASEVVKKDIINYLSISYMVEESSLNRSNLSFEIIEIEEPLDKIKIINEILDEKIDIILGNVANLGNKIIYPISQKTDIGYPNAGIIFTIYGPIGAKKSVSSIMQSAEGIYDELSKKYKNNLSDYLGLFFSESPNFDMEVCPRCNNIDILESKKDRQSQQHQVYFDNIEEKFYLSYNQKVKFYQKIENKDPFFVCNNPSCMRKSFEENEENYKNPKKTDKFEDLPNKKEENKKWRNLKKNQIQESFKKNKLGLLVTTKGFGMGIDKSNIRYIIHTTLSSSLESYYQEIGRSGRDKEHSHCILLFCGPTKSCIYETDDLKEELPCMKDPSDFAYQRCPKGLNTMCDIARQQKMMISPIVIKIKENQKSRPKEKFLHEFLGKKEFLDNIENYIQIGEFGEAKIIDILKEKISSSFSHPLIEFFEGYICYQDRFKNNLNDNNFHFDIKNDDNASSGYEKIIYRFMCMGIFDKYFKSYPNGLSSVRFEIYTINNIGKDKNIKEKVEFEIFTDLKKYLDEKLEISANNISEAFEIQDDFYEIFLVWLKNQDMILKNFWVLVYFSYKKVFYQRQQMLKNLYDSIKDGENNCFRNGIMSRLSGIKDSSDGCGFCSGCQKDTTRFIKTEGLLAKDILVRNVNNIIKKKFVGEKVTEEEEKAVEKYETKINTEAQIKSLFESIDKDGFLSFDALIKKCEETGYSILPSIQKKLEFGTSNFWYYFLSAYFEPSLFEERLDESINLLKKSQENKEYFDFGKSINLFSEKYQKSIKNKLKTIENNELKNYIDMGFLSQKFDINDKKMQKILLLGKLHNIFNK